MRRWSTGTSLILLLATASWAQAQGGLPAGGLPGGGQAPTATKVFADPFDGTQFQHPIAVSANGLGGFDSDGCAYSSGPQARATAIATSPTTLFSAPFERFDRRMTEEQKDGLLPILVRLGEDVEDASTLEPAERFEIAAVVADYLGDGPYAVGDLHLAAAWTVRDSIVGFLPNLKGPGDQWSQLVELTPQAAAVTDPKYRTIALFDMARLSHRGGFSVERDDFLSLLDTYTPTEGALGKRTEFLLRVAREEELLARARASYQEGLTTGQGTPEQQSHYRYLVGDLSRRLGQYDEAKTQLEAVSLDARADAETKALVTDILAVLRVQSRESTVKSTAAPESK